MPITQYQIPLQLSNQPCWLGCDPSALSQLAMNRLGGKLLDRVTLAPFLVQHPNWLLISLFEIGPTLAERQKCKWSDVQHWFISTDRLAELVMVPTAKKNLKSKKSKKSKSTKSIIKRLAAIESADELKDVLRKLVDKPFREPVSRGLAECRIAKSVWKSIRQSAREGIAQSGRHMVSERDESERYPDYVTIFKTLCSLEETQAEFDHQLLTQKLDAMRLLAYGASHEINNPLANIATRAQALLPGESDLKRKQRLTVIYEQAMRAHEMISDMMLFAHPPRLNRTAANLREIVDRVVTELQTKMTTAQVVCKIQSDSEMGPVFQFDATQVAAGLKALLANSIEAIGVQGRIDIEIKTCEQGTTLRVCDNGPGIDDSISDNIFDPFFSGREAGRGLGFGLSKAWRIFELHGATLCRQQSENGGATFEIRFPQADSISKIAQCEQLDRGPHTVDLNAKRVA